MPTQPRLKHLGEMLEEYRDFYNEVLKEPDEPALTWLAISKRGSFSDAHMANIKNNRAGKSRKTGEILPFRAIPLEMVDKVLKGIGNPELREWFYSASNVDTSDEIKARQFTIEQDLRTRGILPSEPRRSIKAPLATKRTPKAEAKKKQSGKRRTVLDHLEAHDDAYPPPDKQKRHKALITNPELITQAAHSVHQVQANGVLADGTKISFHGLKMETHAMRLSIETVSIEGGNIQTALGLLLNIGGKKE